MRSEVASLKPRYDAVLKQTDDVKAKCGPSEAAAIDARVSELSSRWNALNDGVEKIVPVLEIGAAKVKEFDDAASEVEPWILARLRVVKSPLLLRAIPDGVKEQISKHKDFVAAVEAKRPAVEELVKIEKDLKTHCSPEDGAALDDRLGRLQSQWDDLIGFCAEREHALDDGLQQAVKFESTWKSTMEAIGERDRVAKAIKPIGHDRDAVSKQLEDIEVRKMGQ